jgi:uncharacterized phage-associated protein
MALKAIEVADFLISQAKQDENSDLLTNLKLQKLLYYAEGSHLAIFGRSLFDDRIEAWDMGPVVPHVYHAFKPCGRQPIEEVYEGYSNLEMGDQRFLNWVCAFYGKYSANRLVTMTHRESPWINAFRMQKNKEISRDDMMNYFTDNWKIKEKIVSHLELGQDKLASEINEAISEVDGRPGISANKLLEVLGV